MIVADLKFQCGAETHKDIHSETEFGGIGQLPSIGDQGIYPTTPKSDLACIANLKQWSNLK